MVARTGCRRFEPMIADVTRGLSEWWAPVLAFVAGVVSFASPCVLPLVPGYLAFVAGTDETEEGSATGATDGASSPNGSSSTATSPSTGPSSPDPSSKVAPSSVPSSSAASRPASSSTPARGMSGGVDVLPDGEGGVAVKAAAAAAVRPRVPIMPMVLFVSGFAIVFTAFGVAVGQAPTGWLNRTLHSEGLLRIAGAFVLLFGVAMILYALRVGSPSLYAERRPFLSKVRPGPAGALPLGMAFALGWTPCIGPVLGAILTIAATQGGALRGGGLLLLYSLGLGLPFLLIGLGVRRLVRVFDVIKRNYRWLAAVSGVVMVAIGFLLVSGLWSSWVTPWLNRLSSVTPPL